MNNSEYNAKYASLPKENNDNDIPIDLSDVLNVCRNYAVLGINIQQQIEHIMEMGIDEAISSGTVKIEVLPHIREFLKLITDNLLGDIVDQCFALMMMIDDFEFNNQHLFKQAN